MFRKIIRLTTWIAAIHSASAIGAVSLGGAELTAAGSPTEALRQAKSAAEMDQVVESLWSDHETVVAGLSRILDSSSSKEIKARACFLLGVFRASSAVPELIRAIDLEVHVRHELDAIAPWRSHPCSEALARVGKPAEEALLNLLVQTEKDQVRRLVSEVLLSIEGREGAELVLRRAIQSASPSRASHLQRGLDAFKEFLTGRKPSPH